MARLHKNAKGGLAGKFIRGVVGDKTFDKFHPIGTSMEKTYDATKATEAAAKAVANEPAIPLPDTEELERLRRRKGRGGGRAATVLTDDGSERLGG